MTPPRLALLFDYPEEGWTSMDLTGTMLYQHLKQAHSQVLTVEQVCPAFHRRAQHVPFLGRTRLAFNTDRLLNRFRDYPRHLRGLCSRYDLYHVCDHSYAHLVHELPAERTGVYCHDLDAFRCLLEPHRERRPRWFRALARRCLQGMQKAAWVFHSTTAVRQHIVSQGLVPESRLIQAPFGTSPEFSPEASSEDSPPVTGPYLLHVGTCVRRKRIDVLLEVFAALRARIPDVRLVKVGTQWTAEQRAQLTALRIAASLVEFDNLNRTTLAALYRGASGVLVTSDAEGFGLPVLEALACGAPVVASDLPALREVGGEAIQVCPVGDIPVWVDTVQRLWTHPESGPTRAQRLAQAARFSWTSHAEVIASAYRRLVL